MSIIAWIAMGLAGGLVVGVVLGGRGRVLLGDMAAATVGAMLGGFLAAVNLGLDIADLDTTTLVTAAVGAGLLLLIIHVLPPTEVFD